MKQKHYTYTHLFQLEKGGNLPEITIAYHTYGSLNENRSNVVWVCHALTANDNAADWWEGIIGDGKYFDPSKHFIVCANILGSCYGTTGPQSINPTTQKPYFFDFPDLTIRDMVNAHQLLKEHLGITQIAYGIGGSMGGYQVQEWAIEEPSLFKNLFLIVTSARESAWGKAIHTSQRMAMEADPTLKNSDLKAGEQGMKAARAIGMFTYRNHDQFELNQQDSDEVIEDYKAESYIRYQGNKLAKRFNAHTYYTLSKAMDTHNVGRGKKSVEAALNSITAKTLVTGVSSDILCPPVEQELMAQHIPNSQLKIIESLYGHDGFLIEHKLITEELVRYFG